MGAAPSPHAQGPGGGAGGASGPHTPAGGRGRPDAAVAALLHSGLAPVARTRQRCVEEGLAAALAERPRPGTAPKLSPKQQAFTVALACTKPPMGRLRWTIQLVADRLVELAVIPDISEEAIRRLLKRTSSSPG